MASEGMQAWLEAFIRAQHGVAGTVHEVRGEVLELVASHNIPPKVIELTRVIPKGKGMGGLAFAEDRPITTCNLKTDESGAVKPGAKAVDAAAAVALPVHDATGKVRAVVGVAFAEERVLGEAELGAIASAAADLPA